MSRMITLRASDQLLERLDALVSRGRYRSRAGAVKAALELLLAEEERLEVDRLIVQGYERVPQTPEEDAYAERSGLDSVREEPW